MSKINDYATATPISTDKVLGTDDPSGTPLTRNFLIETLLGLQEFGELVVTGGSSGQTSIATLTQVNQFTADGQASANITPAHGSDNITIGKTGRYRVSFYATFTADSGTEVTLSIYYNGSAVSPALKAVEQVPDGNEHTVAFEGIVNIATASNTLDVRASLSDAAHTLTLIEARLSVHRIGNAA